MDTPLLTICCVCAVVLKAGEADEKGRVSHGMCQPCAEAWKAEWQARKAAMSGAAA